MSCEGPSYMLVVRTAKPRLWGLLSNLNKIRQL